jgi:hypothetical protein
VGISASMLDDLEPKIIRARLLSAEEPMGEVRVAGKRSRLVMMDKCPDMNCRSTKTRTIQKEGTA